MVKVNEQKLVQVLKMYRDTTLDERRGKQKECIEKIINKLNQK